MKLLFVRFSALGDILLTTGLIRYVKSQLPEAQIDILTADGMVDIYRSLPEVAVVHSIPRGVGARHFLRFARTLPAYDSIFDLHANTRTRLLKLAVSSPVHTYKKQSTLRRLYVKYRLFGNRLTRHVIEKYAEAVLKPLGLVNPGLEALRPSLPMPENYIHTGHILIHPFASKKTKEWPHVTKLIELLQQQGETVAVIGNGCLDLPVGTLNYLNKTTLPEMFALIAGAKAVITTDSGPLHAATAFNRPTVALFGPTTKHFGFYPSFQGITVLEDTSLTCRPCHVHGLNECPKKHFQCMLHHTPEGVAQAVKASLL